MEDIIVYVQRDENGSIVSIRSSIFIDDIEGWEKVDEWQEGQDRYLYVHADNGEYVQEKHGNTLRDELGRPNFKGNFELLSDEEKEQLYPITDTENQTSELEELKERQLILENALQDMILMTMEGGDE